MAKNDRKTKGVEMNASIVRKLIEGALQAKEWTTKEGVEGTPRMIRSF
jgi:CHASE2 domain-containing sensor protein